jgi:HSP20 family protein
MSTRRRSQDVLDVPAAADYLGVGEWTVRDQARRGRLPAVKTGKEWRFSRAALEQWLANQFSNPLPAEVRDALEENRVRWGDEAVQLSTQGQPLTVAEFEADAGQGDLLASQSRNPWVEPLAFQGIIGRMLEDPFVRAARATLRSTQYSQETIPIDVVERDGELVVEASLPGIPPEDISLTIQGSTLVIEGKPARGSLQGSPEQEAQGRYLHRERFAGPVYRQITLPVTVDTDRVEARFVDGVLTVVLPEAAGIQPRQIVVAPTGRGQKLPARRQQMAGAEGVVENT